MISFHFLHTSRQLANSSTRGSWQNTISRTSQGSQFREGSSDSTSRMKLSGRRNRSEHHVLQKGYRNLCMPLLVQHTGHCVPIRLQNSVTWSWNPPMQLRRTSMMLSISGWSLHSLTSHILFRGEIRVQRVWLVRLGCSTWRMQYWTLYSSRKCSLTPEQR